MNILLTAANFLQQKFKSEGNDDKNQIQRSNEYLCHEQISRTEENAQPGTTAGNNNLGLRSNSEEKWDEMFHLLREYKTEHGHTNVPSPYTDNPKLGHWVSDQRTGYREFTADNKQNNNGMTEERINELESIGFKWTGECSSKAQVWNEIFEELKQFKAKYGHTDVPRPNADNPKLGKWVSTQRQGYSSYKSGNKQRSQGICEERIQQLESIGFNWVSERTPKKQVWNEMLEDLKQFKVKHGHTNVPKPYVDNPKLGHWVGNQRRGYREWRAGNKRKSKGMTTERIQRLESIEFKWDIRPRKKQKT